MLFEVFLLLVRRSRGKSQNTPIPSSKHGDLAGRDSLLRIERFLQELEPFLVSKTSDAKQEQKRDVSNRLISEPRDLRPSALRPLSVRTQTLLASL